MNTAAQEKYAIIPAPKRRRPWRIIGLSLIVYGFLTVIEISGIYTIFPIGYMFNDIAALFFLVLLAFYFLRSVDYPVQQKVNFTRSQNDFRLTGVSGGLAEYIDVPTVLIRVFWIIISFITLGGGIIVYFSISLYFIIRDYKKVDGTSE